MKCRPVRISSEGNILGEIAAERVVLDYPGLTARPEVCMSRTIDGDIWAAIGFNTGVRGAGGHLNPEYLFRSSDGGHSWSGNPMAPTGDRRMCGFTSLSDDSFLLTVGPINGQERNELRIYRSVDYGKTWGELSAINSDPFDRIAGSFESITETVSGTVLLPAVCHSGKELEGRNAHYVFPSMDGGRTWCEPFITFKDVYEPHILQLKSGKLLGAFRYQRGALPDDPPDIIQTMGAGPGTIVPGIPGSDSIVFKHVFVGDSFDDGRTWQNLRPLKTKEGRPIISYGECHGQLTQLADGRVVMVHDKRYPYDGAEVIARVSEDEGVTWLPETFHVSVGHGYPASIGLDDGFIVTVTGATPYDAQANVLEGWKAEAVIWKLP